MKMRFFIVFFIVSLSVNAQNSGYIEYAYHTNRGITYETTGVLEFTRNQSKFTLLKSGNSTIAEEVNDNEIDLISESKKRPTNYINLDSNDLLSNVTLFKKVYVTQEAIPRITWNIKNEFKLLNNIECQKAEGYFRGRTYTVWFANKLTLPFGPWKLQGLPGIIMEARDSKNEIYFRAKKIKLGESIQINYPKEVSYITLKEFIKLKPKIFKEREEMLKSKMPRSNTVFKLQMPPRTSQREIIYEWEEN